MCLAQGHNAVTRVRLEPRGPGLESSTLPLSHCPPNLPYSDMYFNIIASLTCFKEKHWTHYFIGFPYFSTKICCWYTLEFYQRGNSNIYKQHVFLFSPLRFPSQTSVLLLF